MEYRSLFPIRISHCIIPLLEIFQRPLLRWGWRQSFLAWLKRHCINWPPALSYLSHIEFPKILSHFRNTGHLSISYSLHGAHSFSTCAPFSRNALHSPPPLAAAAAAKSPQSCPTLCDPINGSPPGSAVPGILQARTLEWGAIAFSASSPYSSLIKVSSPDLRSNVSFT